MNPDVIGSAHQHQIVPASRQNCAIEAAISRLMSGQTPAKISVAWTVTWHERHLLECPGSVRSGQQIVPRVDSAPRG